MIEEKEIWKEIIGYEGKYWVSNLGRIKSNYLGETIFHPAKDRLGYLRVSLTKNKKSVTFSVHRLVALHFVPNPRYLNEINHIDGNKENNRWDNLEWCMRKENMQHAAKTGLLVPPPHGENSPLSKVFFQFDLKGNLIKIWKGINDCARQLLKSDPNVQKEYNTVRNLRINIGATLNGRHKSCCGYLFSFSPEVDLKEHEWIKHYKPVMAIDKKTGEEFTFDYIQSLEDYIMPNGQRTQATMIVKACKGKRKSHAGYFWKYLENNKK